MPGTARACSGRRRTAGSSPAPPRRRTSRARVRERDLHGAAMRGTCGRSLPTSAGVLSFSVTRARLNTYPPVTFHIRPRGPTWSGYPRRASAEILPLLGDVGAVVAIVTLETGSRPGCRTRWSATRDWDAQHGSHPTRLRQAVRARAGRWRASAWYRRGTAGKLVSVGARNPLLMLPQMLIGPVIIDALRNEGSRCRRGPAAGLRFASASRTESRGCGLVVAPGSIRTRAVNDNVGTGEKMSCTKADSSAGCRRIPGSGRCVPWSASSPSSSLSPSPSASRILLSTRDASVRDHCAIPPAPLSARAG